MNGRKQKLREWEERLRKAARVPPGEELRQGMFVPANSNLDVLEEYRGGLGNTYWDKWERSPNMVGWWRRVRLWTTIS